MMTSEESGDESDVPPLEDMSSFLREKTLSKPVVVGLTKPVSVKAVIDNLAASSSLEIPPKKREFAGLKKGFFKKNEKLVSDSKSDSIPFLKGIKNSNSLEIKSLKKAFDDTRDQWLTPSFLDEIERSPVLAAAFQEPLFCEISQKLDQDPIGTMKYVSESHPKYLEALRQFSLLMGQAMEDKAKEMGGNVKDQFGGGAKVHMMETKQTNLVMEKQQVQETPLNDFERGLVEKVMCDPVVQVTFQLLPITIGRFKRRGNSRDSLEIKRRELQGNRFYFEECQT